MTVPEDTPIADDQKENKSKLFAHENECTKHRYPENYRIKSIEEQVAILRYYFPLKYVRYDRSIATRPLPKNAEGWFAIPLWHLIKRRYDLAVSKANEVIATTRRFHNFLKPELKLGVRFLRQHPRTEAMFNKLSDGNGILIVACQFGLLHRGRSIRGAREIFSDDEFGLGAFAVNMMLLTHPERLLSPIPCINDQLNIDCAGDEICKDVCFDFAPFFYNFMDEMNLSSDAINRAREYSGSASAFLPAEILAHDGHSP